MGHNDTMPQSDTRILDVGQCDFDHGNISQLLSEEFDATVDRAANIQEARGAIQKQQYSLILVNRVLDADGSSGLDLIQQLRSQEPYREIPIALVSNYEDAQDAAVALGAKRGFGKNALDSPDTKARLASLLNIQK